MPKMGESVSEGTIVKWHRREGERIEIDETLLEIVTDKVDTEIPSPATGIVKKLMFGEGETVPVGTVIAILEEEGEEKKERRFYSPLVMNIARREGISTEELKTIEGSGTGGRVTKKDILEYVAKRKKGALLSADREEAKAEVPKEALPGRGEVEGRQESVSRIPLEPKRKQIIKNLTSSRDTSVHVASMIEVDMSAVSVVREMLKADFQREGIKLTYLPFIVEACAKALRRYPLLNSSLSGEEILIKNYVNIGIAVAVGETELIVPNIKGADRMNLLGIARAIDDLAKRAREGSLKPEDVSEGTFSITNYGSLGTLFGTPIIKQPEVAILGVGAVTKRVVVIEGGRMASGESAGGSGGGTSLDYTGDSIGIRPIVMLSLSYDHRIIDGMLGGLFLKDVKDYLENYPIQEMPV